MKIRRRDLLKGMAGGLALAALATVGCVTPPVITGAPPPDRSVFSPEKPAYSVSEKTEAMKVALDISAADDASAAFATGVRETAVSALRKRKFQIVEDGANDLKLSMSARQTPFDTTGEYVALDGVVSASLDDAATGNVLAEKTFRGRNKASLGMEKATADLAEAMRPEISDWIAETVTPEQIPLDVRTLRVTHIDHYPGGESAFIDDFVAALSGMSGVLRCETAARDAAPPSATFRVLYRRDDYPQGFVHAVIRRNPSFGLVLQ